MQTFRQRVRTIVFESETRAGRAFDAAVIGCVLASVVAVFLDSIPAVHRAHADVLYGIEWFFTILFTVLSLVVVCGSIMYLVEGEANGFTSILISMYWAVVTVTTVGYGDISPATALGRFIASALMILGYAIIAVPTGIFSVQLTEAMRKRESNRACPRCAVEGHSSQAAFCWRCGSPLHPELS
jgi:hypothetical protein